jgi:hypothetical protein
VFCYLNDVERGGTTYFPDVDLEIRPRKGVAVVTFTYTASANRHCIDVCWC